MRKVFWVLLVSFLAVVLLAAGAAVYAIRHSSDILITQIEKNLGVAASAAQVTVLFPATVVIRDLRVGDQLQAERLVITPSIAGFFLKKAAVFNEVLVTRPRVQLVRRADDTLDVGLPPRPPQAPPAPGAPAGPPPEEKEGLPVYVEHLKVIDGRVSFIDEAVATPPFQADIVAIQLETRRVSLLKPMRIRVEVTAQVGGGGKVVPGRLTGRGEYDIETRKGHARLDIGDVPLALFQPYYVRYFKPVRSGTAALASDIRVDGNDVTVDGSVSLKGVLFERPAPEETQDKKTSWADLGTALMSAFFFPEGDATVALSITTHLDKPRFENVKIKGGSMRPAGIEASAVSPGAAAGDFKKIGKEFEAFGKDFKKMFDF